MVEVQERFRRGLRGSGRVREMFGGFRRGRERNELVIREEIAQIRQKAYGRKAVSRSQ